MSVVISLLIYILFKIISIVSSNATFVNNDATSNETIVYPSRNFCFWMYLRNSLVLLIVNSDLLNGANKLAKYFAVLYMAVPILDAIVLNVESSTLLVKSLSIQLKMLLSLMVYSVLSNRINISIKSRVKVIKLRHNKKIRNLCKLHGIDKFSKTKPLKNVINDFSLYHLTEEEIQALSHSLDQHIPLNPDRYKINTDFEYFYQNVLNDISDLQQHHLDNIKTKLRSTCIIIQKQRKNIKKLLTGYQNKTILLSLNKTKGVE